MQIDFPPIDPPLVALGRNDWFIAVGVDIVQLIRPERVALTNMNSKGWLGRHQLTLPATKDVLRQVADELNRIADNL